MIPKTIHQIWFQGQDELQKIPRYTHFQRLWREFHPDWQYRLWDGRSIDQFVQRSYPEFYDLYDSYPQMIQKIDVAKYFLLKEHGGFYIDMDMECVKSLEPLVRYELLLAELRLNAFDMFAFTFNQIKQGPFINNACIASIPQHPFWIHVTERLREHRSRKPYYTHEYYVSSSTGPQFLTKMVQDYHLAGSDAVFLAPPEYFEPYSLGNTAHKELATAFAVHRQDNTWLTGLYKGLKYLRYGTQEKEGFAATHDMERHPGCGASSD